MKNKLVFIVTIFVIGVVGLNKVAEAENGDTKVTFSGNNFFEARYGKKPRDHGIFEDMDFFWDGEYRIQPWYYVKDFIDMNIGINKFYVRSRFQVDLPSMGYHPENIYWYREFLSLRTFGYDGDILNGEVGNFKTEFGRGITISLKEDPLVELSNILDGVYLWTELPLGTIKGFAGRNINDQNYELHDPDYNTINLIENYQFRDNVLGAHIEMFPFSNLPLISASSIGGGLINFRNQVSKLEEKSYIDSIITSTDTLLDTTYVYSQPRKNIYMPSWLANLSIGDITLYGEFARGYTEEYTFSDSLRKDTLLEKKSFAAFLELSAPIGDFYLRGEYKNYFYEYTKGIGIYDPDTLNPGNIYNFLTGDVLARYTDAPWARYKHLWHLLAKRTLIPHVQDELGYNAEVTWTPSDRTQLLLTGSFGGRHKLVNEEDSTKFSMVTFKTGELGSYYDIYAELNQKIGEKIDLKVGIDYGKIDPKEPHILYRTLASKLDIGQFNEKHSFGIDFEFQANTFTSLAEGDYFKVKDLVMKNVPISEINPNDINNPDPSVFAKYYTSQLADEFKTEQDNTGINVLTELIYEFTSLLKLSCLLEYETLVRGGVVIDNIETKSRFFPSGGFTFTPVEDHTFTLEAGSFSRKKICNMGVCTILPSFIGFKFRIISKL